MYNLGIFLLYFALATGDIELSETEKEWVFLADILRSQTACIDDPAEKLVSMTEWLHANVRHVPGGRYPRSFNSRTIATVIKGGVGNCGYQSYNIVGFSQMLGYSQHRVLHHRKKMGAPGDHTFAEINIDGKWIIYDPDNFLYFRSVTGDLLSVDEVAADSSSWIGISMANKAFKETKSAKRLPKSEFKYTNYELAGMSYIRLLTKMQQLIDEPDVKGPVVRR
ncbi:MAG: transglutaminase domain-containing protein [Saprospiraceae bacterium]|nr:transglutaminase domain-containing protein [Saprospiraceae bacterium]